MSSIVVRGLDPRVKSQLAEQAIRNGRSMEAEARHILTQNVARPNIILALAQAVREADALVELHIPPRGDHPRAATFE